MMQVIDCDPSYAPEILAILNEAIANSTALYEYRARTLDSMDEWFAGKRGGNYPVIGVGSHQDRLLGFATYGPFRSKPAYKYTVEHSVYVDPAHRRRGVGRLLLETLIARAREQDYHVMIGGIDGENAVSIRLHEQCGFVPCGTIRQAGFKFGRWLDLVFYQRVLDTPARPVDG